MWSIWCYYGWCMYGCMDIGYGYNYHHCQRVDGCWLLSSMEGGDFEGGSPGGEQPMETFNGETFSFSSTMFQMILAVEISTFISPPLFSFDLDYRSWNTYSFRRPGKDVGTTHSMRYQGWDNLLRCDIPRARAFV